MCPFNRFPLTEIPLVFCIPRLLAFRPITVLLLPGIAYEKATAVVAADQDSIATSVIRTEKYKGRIFRKGKEITPGAALLEYLYR